MVVLITNANNNMIKRFLDSDMGDKIFWIAETSDGNIMCLEESTYLLESGVRYNGTEFINIRSGEKCFTIYNGEYDTLVME